MNKGVSNYSFLPIMTIEILMINITKSILYVFIAVMLGLIAGKLMKPWWEYTDEHFYAGVAIYIVVSGIVMGITWTYFPIKW